MPAPYTGRCGCGAVTLEISSEPTGTRQCWCRQCQQIAAGGATHNAIFAAEDVAIEGPIASFAWTAASGNSLTAWFCSGCGTQIYAQSSARLHLKTVRLGAIDEPHGLRPAMAIWTDDAPDWAVIDPALEHCPGQPPAPPVQPS